MLTWKSWKSCSCVCLQNPAHALDASWQAKTVSVHRRPNPANLEKDKRCEAQRSIRFVRILQILLQILLMRLSFLAMNMNLL